ncbi:MAG: hypothetical protein ACKO0M_12480 [Cyanobium sp.]
MAAPIAYEQPTVNKSWQAFVDHFPTLALVFLVTLALAVVGVLLSYLVAGAVAAMIHASGGLSSLANGEDLAASGARVFGQFSRLPIDVLVNFIGVLGMAVPAMYYQTGEVITPGVAFGVLFKRPLRYLLAGLLYTVVAVFGFILCVLPGIAVLLVAPVFVNRIFNTDEQIIDAFFRSFQGVFRSEHGWTFVGIELLVGLCVIVVTICTCGLGGLVAGPMGTFYVMNSAYRYGVLR